MRRILLPPMPPRPSKQERPGRRRKDAPAIVSTSDLARYLNLSRWTVSRAINGHPEVHEDTRRRVLEAMEALQFHPNPFARSLRGGGTGFVGICFTDLESPMLNAKVFHLQEFLRRHRLRSLLETKWEGRASEENVIEDFRRIRVEGMVLVNSALEPKQCRRLVRGLACVHVDPQASQLLPSVALDRSKAMRLLFEHLLDFGHRRFALLGIDRDDRWRWVPLSETARKHGLDPAAAFTSMSRLQREGRSMIEFGRWLAHKALHLPKRPTAFIALDDHVAVGAVQTLKEAGLRVPQDISVTGFNNQDLARELRPTLTTIEQFPDLLMEQAGLMLLDQIALPSEKRGRHLAKTTEPRLIIGESTGAAPQAR